MQAILIRDAHFGNIKEQKYFNGKKNISPITFLQENITYLNFQNFLKTKFVSLICYDILMMGHLFSAVMLSYIGTYVWSLWIKPKMYIAPDLVLTTVNSRFWGKSLRTASNQGYVSRMFSQFLTVCNSGISWTKSYVFVFKTPLGIFIPCVHPVAFEIQQVIFEPKVISMQTQEECQN